MFAIATTPVKQSVSETITTLSGRLSSSTLLEDRRAAILGLRSFAKDYPASVASDALRALIESLGKDREDVDTVKIVLETLLMLFNPNENSPEASEEIALWLADEFTQRQDNIVLLLDFLDATKNTDFYSRLYSLQLLSAILASRTERTEECIFTAPLGISNLVAVLDDKREAVRNEGLALLTYLTPSSSELQKLVAFENVFDRIFNIIDSEGSLFHGDRIVEDCLILLANLLRLNASNQSFFRETGSVRRLSKILGDALSGSDSTEELAEWAQVQKNRNVYALLAVLRLCLVPGGGLGTRKNQESFCQYGILNQTLQLAFASSTEAQIKAEALVTCADLIRGNHPLQEGFALIQVNSVLDNAAEIAPHIVKNGDIPKVYVIDGLLDLALCVPSLALFDSRYAACECIKAYITTHDAIRKYFLSRAMDGHSSGANESANILTALLQPSEGRMSGDPYRYWFSAVLALHLIFDDHDAKSVAMKIAEGDASSGEEVVTCIQTIMANLISGIQKSIDERISTAYLMLLSGWLFEDLDAVSDFLGEGSNIQSLVQVAVQGGGDSIIVPGLCAFLLGIVYEFSTKDSPVPRATIHSIFMSRMGREQYIDRLTKLRSHPLLRDFEVLPQNLSSAGVSGVPEVFFDETFANFVRDNYSRILRTFDREPSIEISVVANGVQQGISREMVDTLRAQLSDREKALHQAEEDLSSRERQLNHEQSEHRKTKETFNLELSRERDANKSLQRRHEEEIGNLQQRQDRMAEDHKREMEHTTKTSKSNIDRTQRRHDAEIVEIKKAAEITADEIRESMGRKLKDQQSAVTKLEKELEKLKKEHARELHAKNEEHNAKLADLTRQLQAAQEKLGKAGEENFATTKRAVQAEKLSTQKEAERKSVQGELDDLLMVFADMEEKCEKYKEKLKALGESVSDDEAEAEAEGEDDDDVD